MASLVRSLVRGFNVRRRVRNLVTNEACLPRPSRLPASVLLRIYGSYLAVWLMLLLQAYSQRLRRLVAAFYYRRREKRRVLHLYNESLRRRLGYLRFARARLARLARARRLLPESRPWLALRLRLPRQLGWLERFACARRRCSVCGESEPRGRATYRLCDEPGCQAVFCEECWADVGRRCLGCDGPDASSAEEEDEPDELVAR